MGETNDLTYLSNANKQAPVYPGGTVVSVTTVIHSIETTKFLCHYTPVNFYLIL